MSRRQLLREKSLLLPEIQNPFVHRLEFSIRDKIQIAFMSVFVVPIRLFFVGFFLVIGWFFAAIALCGYKKEDYRVPMSGWRSLFRPIVVFFCRMVFWAGGFYWITTRGRRLTSKEAPILAVAPHSSYFDALPVVFFDLTSIVAKSSVQAVPIFGTLTKFTQPVFVSREDPNSRQNTIKEIKRRAQAAGEWPQIIIFPEGTCTNRTCLISFKGGAFYPGVTVQPVCLRYKNRMDTVTWTWDGPGAFEALWLTLCQFNNKLEVEYLPPYTPSEEEKNDPKLFSTNVRKIMAEALKVPVTDHTYEDCRLMEYASKLNLPAAVGLVEFSKLHKKLGMNFDNAKEMLTKFCSIAQNSEGLMSLEQFAAYLDIPVSEPLKALFELCDRSASGTVDFREYVIALHLIVQPAKNDDTIQFAFQLFDKGGKGFIEEEELQEILFNAFGMEEIDVQRLFAQVDADADGKITYDEFRKYAEEKPEYCKLFTTYHEMQQDAVPDHVDTTAQSAFDPSEQNTANHTAEKHKLNHNHTDRAEKKEQ